MEENILELSSKLIQIKDELSQMKETKTKLEKKKKETEYALWNAMSEKDIQSFKHEQHGTIYRSHKVWCKIIDTNKAFKFLKEYGVYDDIMKLEAKTGRLNKLIKEEFIDKTGVVPEIEIGIQVTLAPMIGNRAAKGGGEPERPEGL